MCVWCRWIKKLTSNRVSCCCCCLCWVWANPLGARSWWASRFFSLRRLVLAQTLGARCVSSSSQSAVSLLLMKFGSSLLLSPDVLTSSAQRETERKNVLTNLVSIKWENTHKHREERIKHSARWMMMKQKTSKLTAWLLVSLLATHSSCVSERTHIHTYFASIAYSLAFTHNFFFQ